MNNDLDKHILQGQDDSALCLICFEEGVRRAAISTDTSGDGVCEEHEMPNILG